MKFLTQCKKTKLNEIQTHSNQSNSKKIEKKRKSKNLNTFVITFYTQKLLNKTHIILIFIFILYNF